MHKSSSRFTPQLPVAERHPFASVSHESEEQYDYNEGCYKILQEKEPLFNMKDVESATEAEALDASLSQVISELGEALARLRFAEAVEGYVCDQYVESINFLKKAHSSHHDMELQFMITLQVPCEAAATARHKVCADD